MTDPQTLPDHILQLDQAMADAGLLSARNPNERSNKNAD